MRSLGAFSVENARTTSLVGLRRVAARLWDASEAGLARRFAASAFLARVFNAGLGFATQILLARWMGEREYGIYAYAWVWLLVAGGIGSLGIPVAALKFVPDYRAKGDLPRLRGFLHFARGPVLLPSVAGALAAAAAMAAWSHGSAFLPVGMIALAVLPIYVLTDIQTGIARAYDFLDLGLSADYLVRPLLVLAFAVAIGLAGGDGSAVNVMLATLAATGSTALVQGVLLDGRLRARIPAGPRESEVRRWSDAAWPLLAVAGFTLLLNATDIIVLKLFVEPEDIAIYFAATKIVAIASFVAYGVSNTSAHRFAEHVATGDRHALAQLAAQTVRWTFWPTVAVALCLAVLAPFLLALFGPQFAAGAPVVTILALGLVAGATVGPADRALAMADHGRLAAGIYGAAFLVNLGLALLLIPKMGLTGAALATALAMATRAALLRVAARRRLGLEMFVGLPQGRGAVAPAHGPGIGDTSVAVLDPRELAAIEPAWRSLAERALEPNVFFGPEMARAGLAHLPEGTEARVLVAWRGVGEARRLVGLLPVVRPRGRHANPLPVWRAAEFYGTLSTPLLDPERPDETLRAMLRAAAGHGQAGILLPFLHAGGPVGIALDEVCTRAGLPQAFLGQHRRALLRSPLRGAEYVRATLETRRRKEADRQRRRLNDEGELGFHVSRDPAGIASDLDAFLALETAGWKGKTGTDLAHSRGAEAFIRSAAAALASEDAFRVATLRLDGKVIAAGLVALAQSRAFYLKTTYDESYGRFSPGLLLTLDLTAHLLDDPDISDADSIAVADHPMIDRVWTERLPIAAVLVGSRPRGGATFRGALAIERLRERTIHRIKEIRVKLSEIRTSRGKDNAGKAVATDAA